MTEIEENQKYLSRIAGEQLSGVSFVMDYLQLQFNDYFLTVLTSLIVRVADQSYQLGDSQYRDALCDRITHIVTGVVLAADHLQVSFDDRSDFIISLKEGASVGAEAINFQFREGGKVEMLVMHVL